jgi:hypothetical protein
MTELSQAKMRDCDTPVTYNTPRDARPSVRMCEFLGEKTAPFMATARRAQFWSPMTLASSPMTGSLSAARVARYPFVAPNVTEPGTRRADRARRVGAGHRPGMSSRLPGMSAPVRKVSLSSESKDGPYDRPAFGTPGPSHLTVRSWEGSRRRSVAFTVRTEALPSHRLQRTRRPFSLDVP